MENYSNIQNIYELASENMLENFKRDIKQFLIGDDIDSISVFKGGEGVVLLKWRGEVKPLSDVYFRITQNGGDLTFDQFKA